MEFLFILFFIVTIGGALLFLGWLADTYPPKDVDAELRKMRREKELELADYERKFKESK